MTRVWAAVRPLALLAAGFVLGFVGNFLGAVWFGHGGTWADIRRAVRRWLEWSGYSPDKQARSRADEGRRRGLGEPDHFDVLPDPPATQPDPFWRHQPLFSGITHIARRGEPCGSCGQEEPR